MSISPTNNGNTNFPTTPFVTQTEATTIERPIRNDDNSSCCRPAYRSDWHAAETLEAAKTGSLSDVNQVINLQGNINATDSRGYTPLMWASIFGHGDVAIRLLECCADPDIANDINTTALMFAAKIGNRTIVQKMLEKLADVNATNTFGSTALAFAVQGGSEDIVSLLLHNGADPNIVDIDGNSVLMYAVKGGNAEIVQDLLGAGAKSNATNIRNETALLMAVKINNLEIVKILVPERTSFYLLNVPDNSGLTPLLLAVSSSFTEIENYLNRFSSTLPRITTGFP